jgi:hypothetical protein
MSRRESYIEPAECLTSVTGDRRWRKLRQTGGGAPTGT